MTEQNGCTEAEAKRAMALAHKLLAEHNISMSQLNEHEQEEITNTVCNFDTSTPSHTQRTIAANLAEHFGVYILGTKSVLFIVGEQSKSCVCKAAVEFAYKEFQREWSVMHKTIIGTRSFKLAARNTYLEGFISGMLTEIVNNESKGALVIRRSAALEAKMKEINPSVAHHSYRKLDNQEYYNQGYKDGARVQRSKNVQGKIETK